MSTQSETDVKPRQLMVRVLVASGAAILLAALATAFVAGLSLYPVWYPVITAPPSAKRQLEEVAALQTHVLPVVKDLRVTWYLNEGVGGDSIYWSRGNFTTDPSRARQDGDNVFDKETEAAFEQFARAIRARGAPSNRLVDAQFAVDGTVRFASFRRRGGGFKFVFNYIYSPGAKPPQWSSNLGPVVLTRIGETDWWFEQAPDD